MDQENKNNDGMDLGGGLNDSDTGVKFQDSGWRAMKDYRESETPKIIRWVIKYSGGLVKDKKQAQYVLLGFVLLVIIISLFLIFGGGGESISKKPSSDLINIPQPEEGYIPR